MQKRKLNDGSYTRTRPTALTRKTDEYVAIEDAEDVEDIEEAEEEDEETFLRRHRRRRGK